eukprot:scaffold238680_cov33-Tisochrysis_lutea.AAC.2
MSRAHACSQGHWIVRSSRMVRTGVATRVRASPHHRHCSRCHRALRLQHHSCPNGAVPGRRPCNPNSSRVLANDERPAPSRYCAGMSARVSKASRASTRAESAKMLPGSCCRERRAGGERRVWRGCASPCSVRRKCASPRPTPRARSPE